MYFDKFLSDFEILNDYKMMSHIGKGCFSTVTLAVHKESNKNYAIKTYEKIDSL
jgi:serine/threonine protein kinase